MSVIAEVAVDLLVVIVLFCLVGGVSHRNGGTCEQPRRAYIQSAKK